MNASIPQPGNPQPGFRFSSAAASRRWKKNRQAFLSITKT
jgi:hypothetical protein